MYELIIIIFASVGIFLLRFLQWHLFIGRRLKGEYFAYVDSWWFLTEARKIRKSNFRVSGKYREDRPEWENHYPPLFQYLLATVPDKYTDGLIKRAVPIVDAFTAAALFFVIAFTTNNLEYGIVGAIVYFSSPMIFQQNFCLCVRPLTILTVFAIYLFSFSFSIPSIIGMSLLIPVILLMHKFATQTVLFTSLTFLIIGRFDYLLSVVMGFLIAMALSRGYYWKVLKAHVNRLRSSDLKQFADSRAKNPLKRTAVLAIYCPWLIFFAISLIISCPDSAAIISTPTFVWIITLTAASIITNFGIARVMGEGWRYLGYLVFPLAFYAVSIINYSPILLWTYIAFAFLGTAISYYYTRRLHQGHKNYLIHQDDINTFKRMSSIEGKKLIAYPNEFTYVISYFSEKDYTTTVDHADIVVFNRTQTEESQYRTLEEKGFSVKLEEKKWITYTR